MKVGADEQCYHAKEFILSVSEWMTLEEVSDMKRFAILEKLLTLDNELSKEDDKIREKTTRMLIQ